MPENHVLYRLAALRLNHLPIQILAWIEHDLAGVDPASIAAILTPDYAVLASHSAITEMVSRRPAARALKEIREEDRVSV
jgi:hypothetical protein